MAMTRVWNVTSDPSSEVPAQNLMVLGKLLRPGQSMQVDDKVLKNAHKVTKDVGMQFLAIGKTAPSYLAAGVKAELPKTVARSHGGVPVAAIAEDAPAKVEEKLSDHVEVKDSVSVETKPSDDDDKGYGKHRNKGR